MMADVETNEPRRIQLSRAKGYRKPENTVSVGRPTRWGNPVVWESRPSIDPDGHRTPADSAEARLIAVEGFRKMLADPDSRAINRYPSDDEIRSELRGKNLACWCPLVDERGERVPCHADVLLEIANGPVTITQPSLL